MILIGLTYYDNFKTKIRVHKKDNESHFECFGRDGFKEIAWRYDTKTKRLFIWERQDKRYEDYIIDELASKGYKVERKLDLCAATEKILIEAHNGIYKPQKVNI